jgi:hypothetical protein
MVRFGKKTSAVSNLKKFCEKNNVTNVSQLPEHKEKVRQTSIKRYGVEHYFKSDVVKDKTITTNLRKYGVKCFTQSDEFLAKSAATNRLNLGCDWPMQSKHVKEKIDWITHAKNRHQTMKKLGLYSVVETKPEITCYETLCLIYGTQNVQKHVEINGWDIDLFVISMNVYLQVDGVYWHGLDRPIEKIKELKNPRDRVILSTIERDKKQNMWFKQQDLRLVRITDKDLISWSKNSVLEQKLINLVNTAKGK